MKTSILYIYLIFASLFLSFDASSQKTNTQDFNCFSILIGKEATVDGSVMLAHNEDDGGERIVNLYKVPLKHNDKTDNIILRRKSVLPQEFLTYEYLWLEIPELEFSDSYMNEYGVVVTSNNCPSKEDRLALTRGSIGYWLRRLMIERSQTAREALELAGSLIEEFGYAASGRTYCIADPNETWMLAVVRGKHWVAQRVPDNHVAIIPNYYTIQEVDLSDTTNFLGSKDLIDYAVERGWYHPREGAFNFRKAYGDPASLNSISNKARNWVAINSLSSYKYDLHDEFPFSFVPKKKLALPDIFEVLRMHYGKNEANILDLDLSKSPHQQGVMSVCSNTNQYGFVAQLRSELPPAIGNIMWLAPRRPCSQAFIPLYSDITKISSDYAYENEATAIKSHFVPIFSFEDYTAGHAYLRFDKKAKEMDSNFNYLFGKQLNNRNKFENKLLKEQAKFEENLLKIWNKNPKKAKKILTKYSQKQLDKS